MKSLSLLGIFLLASLLTACTTPVSTPPTASPPATGEVRKVGLQALQSWNINGKIAVRTPNDAGSATVDWSEHAGRYHISLLGPLGSHGLKLTGSPGSVVMETSEGKRYTATSADQLLLKYWGFNLPVSSLNYWIRGLPVPGAASSTRLDSAGRLSELLQRGFRVRYLSYKQVGDLDLPEKMSITSTQLNVKIMVYAWKIK